uniref:Uncharacterized protein n=1 Tax=Anguilla anguilla TaxID=7936 RepID=A0A0E9RN21_ANGAN
MLPSKFYYAFFCRPRNVAVRNQTIVVKFLKTPMVDKTAVGKIKALWEIWVGSQLKCGIS